VFPRLWNKFNLKLSEYWFNLPHVSSILNVRWCNEEAADHMITTTQTTFPESKAYLKLSQKLGAKEPSNCRFQFKKRPQSLPWVHCNDCNSMRRIYHISERRNTISHHFKPRCYYSKNVRAQARPHIRVAKQDTEEFDLLGHNAVQFVKRQVALLATCFHAGFLLAYSSTPKMEATCSSETSADFLWAIRRCIPEDKTIHNNCCENIKS
jgi:hypothetical protein